MRIRFTLDIERSRRDEEPERDVQLDSLAERSDRYPIGFRAEPGRSEPEPMWGDRRKS